MTGLYLNRSRPHLGRYQIYRGPLGFRWTWTEGLLEDCIDHGQWFSLASEAWEDAARDWEDNGGSFDKRFVGTLRAAATRARKAEGGDR